MPNELPSMKFTAKNRGNAAKSSNNNLISVRLPEDLLARLAEVGNEEGFVMSDTIRMVLERGLRATKEKRNKQ